MSDAIGPGDWVECISNGEDRPGCGGRGYKIGALYVVSDVHLWRGFAQINCVGRVRPEEFGLPNPGWSIRAFRPIYRPRADFIESLKQPAPSPTPEPIGA